ncbi:hypothetical protein B5E58_03585 [Tyzzerella sp. An114]|uniref:PadR family transcriptional regulator n=1 Tax=Tyzzerella sp. An114 TaxID=1965545 RepID=UPI000B440571|nr:PadR family transcriptional regulator [Tyzzerella sp. An114]OUQ59527.1 hypothetical protein B5E58_03585 [Tyzzerella sp. An114]HIT73900.1 PadR family transcriptional regulator [Candidatus Fimicola cottocaccae]
MKFPFIKMNILQYMCSYGELTGYSFMRYCREKGIKVSSGTIYPHLKELEELGIISFRQDGKRKVYTITEKGQEFIEKLSTNDTPQMLYSSVTRFYNVLTMTIWNDIESLKELKKSVKIFENTLDEYIDIIENKEE